MGVELNRCKRCGPTVCKFVAETCPFAKNFLSASAHDTWLRHVFYDGNGWTQSPVAAPGHPAKKRRTDAMLGWHHSMFGHLMGLVHDDLQWVRANIPPEQRSQPLVAIVCALQRVALPLAVLCNHLFAAGEVKVYLHHAVRGLSLTCVHAIHHRRYLDPEDNQYAGIQGELERWYMVYTRGQRSTTMWLETQPFGTPDGGWKASVAQKRGKDGKSWDCSKKMTTFAHKRNQVIAQQALPWFDLGAAGPWSRPWTGRFHMVFGRSTNIIPRVLQEIEEKMVVCWEQIEQGDADLPKLGMGGGQFHDADHVLQALVAGQESEDGQLVRAFAEERRDRLRAKGHGKAMAEWYVPLLADPAVNPGDETYDLLALGWGIVAVPGPIVELSADPAGGLTRVALPFLNVSGLAPVGASGAADPMDLVEPMLQAVAVVVWNLAETLFPDKVLGASLKQMQHKVEVVKDDDGGDLWFNKSCSSNRIATGIVNPYLKKGKK